MVKQDFIIIDTDNLVKKSNKQQYIKPCLITYGDVRDITLGVSFPGAESGSGGTRCNDTGPFDLCPP